MKKYHYSDGKETFGPFSPEELKEKGISRETLVWFPEITEWTRAGEIPELEGIFGSALPQPEEPLTFSSLLVMNNANGAKDTVGPGQWEEMKKLYGEDKYTIVAYYDENGQRIKDTTKPLVEAAGSPKSHLTSAILVTLFCCLPFGVVAIVNAAKVESRYAGGDIEGAERASAEAGKWVDISIWTGLAVLVIRIIYFIGKAMKYI